MRLDEFVPSRVVEAVVHGLNLTDAIGRAPIATPEGVADGDAVGSLRMAASRSLFQIGRPDPRYRWPARVAGRRSGRPAVGRCPARAGDGPTARRRRAGLRSFPWPAPAGRP